jgi:hypothetical protein
LIDVIYGQDIYIRLSAFAALAAVMRKDLCLDFPMPSNRRCAITLKTPAKTIVGLRMSAKVSQLFDLLAFRAFAQTLFL